MQSYLCREKSNLEHKAASALKLQMRQALGLRSVGGWPESAWKLLSSTHQRGPTLVSLPKIHSCGGASLVVKRDWRGFPESYSAELGCVLGSKDAWPRRAGEDEEDIVASCGLGQPTSCLRGCRVKKGINTAGLRLPALEGPPCKVGPGLASQDVAPKAFPDTAGALYLNCLYKQRDLSLTSAFLLGIWNFGTC